MRKKFIYFISTLLYTTTLYSNPSPLGIELNKSTLDDVKKSYRVVQSSQNATEGYHNSLLDIENIQMDTLSEAVVISNETNIVEGVVLTLDKNKFDDINQTLSGKYKTLSSKIPFVGNKLVTFQDGDCHIIINAPHMSFSMSVAYVTKNLENKHSDRVDSEQKAKQQQTKNML